MRLAVRSIYALCLTVLTIPAVATVSLERAVKAGNVAAVRALIEQGTPADTRLDIGRTPLIAAAVKGHTSLIQYLLSAGADINAQDNNGSTALIMAIYEGHFDAVKALVDAGADVRIKNHDGWTAITLTRSDLRPAATRHGKYAQMHAMLLAAQSGQRAPTRPTPADGTTGSARGETPPASTPPGQLVMARTVNAPNLDPAQFAAAARQAFEGRGWFVSHAGQSTMVGTLSKNGTSYQAEFRWHQPLVVVGFTDGRQRNDDAWIRYLEQDFVRAVRASGQRQ